MSMQERRRGDTTPIPGDYQFRAITSGPRPQRFWHWLKLYSVDRYLPELRGGARAVDVGTGSGVLAHHVATRGVEVIAYDIRPEALAFIKSMYGDELYLVRGLADDLPFQDGRVDIVLALEMIEHLYPDQIRHLFAEVQRVLSPSGVFFLTTPNYRSPWPVIEWLLDFFRLVPRLSDEQHVTKPTFALCRSFAEQNGLEVEILRRGFGAAPFLAVFGWRFAQFVNWLEELMGNPFGNLIIAKFRRARAKCGEAATASP